MFKLKLTRNNLRLIGVVGTLLFIAVVGMIVWINHSYFNMKTQPEGPVSLKDVEDGARSYLANNDTDGGLKYYDEQIEARQSDEEKRSMLLYKANFAQQSKRFDEALVVAEQADKIASDTASAQAIAKAYDAIGNKEQALFYYKKALELSPKEGMGARYNPVLEELIRGLEQ